MVLVQPQTLAVAVHDGGFEKACESRMEEGRVTSREEKQGRRMDVWGQYC